MNLTQSFNFIIRFVDKSAKKKDLEGNNKKLMAKVKPLNTRTIRISDTSNQEGLGVLEQKKKVKTEGFLDPR